jgi:hypothetical protein
MYNTEESTVGPQPAISEKLFYLIITPPEY